MEKQIVANRMCSVKQFQVWSILDSSKIVREERWGEEDQFDICIHSTSSSPQLSTLNKRERQIYSILRELSAVKHRSLHDFWKIPNCERW